MGPWEGHVLPPKLSVNQVSSAFAIFTLIYVNTSSSGSAIEKLKAPGGQWCCRALGWLAAAWFRIQLLANTPGKQHMLGQAVDSCHPVGIRMHGVLGSWLQRVPVLVITGIWDVNRWMEDLSLLSGK